MANSDVAAELRRLRLSDNHLTAREEQVIDLIRKKRLGNKEIANELGISERTAKFHVSSLLQKFSCKSRMELV